MPPNQGFPSHSSLNTLGTSSLEDDDNSSINSQKLRCAILGCGMMGQEHLSYMLGYKGSLSVDYLCDPYVPSLERCVDIITADPKDCSIPKLLSNEEELYAHVSDIDLLVIATPNHLHTDSIMKWGRNSITILCEKPAAVSQDQHDRLQAFSKSGNLKARVWIAMEYRYIPAIAQLIRLLPTIGQVKLLSIRENRYPFLHKIGAWNRDRNKTGDTLVEKCCHFFDLMRLISGQEVQLDQVRAIAQRGLNYDQEVNEHPIPIIDSAYVVMPFLPRSPQEEEEEEEPKGAIKAMGCLELCMYAEGSRHQEEIIVTGTKGRLEAYLPENKVYRYERPTHKQWKDRSVPPPSESIQETVYDCSNVKDVHGIDSEIPTHGGYHYCSTAIEWYMLLGAVRSFDDTGDWKPQVSLDDGLRAVEVGLNANRAVFD